MQAIYQANAQRYNDLPAVEVANAALRKQTDGDSLVARFGGLFRHYRMEQHWGLTLLHNHWMVTEDEFPGERAITEQGRTRFITQPRIKAEINEFVPCAIALFGDEWHAFEYASTDWAKDAFGRLQASVDFLHEVNTAIRAAGMTHLIGLRATRDLKVSSTWWVEDTEYPNRSILTEQEADPQNEAAYIETFWPLSKHASAACRMRCRPRGPGRPKHERYHRSVDD